MKVRSLHIEHLHLTLPRTTPRVQHDASTLAKAVVKTLATSLEQGGLSAGSQQIPKLQLQVPRKQANAAGIARAIQASIGRSGAPGKKET